ncbi:hypothetical protein DFH07DRAFT_785056 [Mycena maculata]|uniref:Uncharacterized protein n=1 Tax=Mycena maculata TaxID=230809 RepID=A0AAD7HD12_9AGAR|nr:hypothetical protein DFH07DRAFT_785056 [Mycena maculata]
MAPIATSLLSFLLAAPLLVSAVPTFDYPRNIAGLPRDANHLALDEETHELIAFRRDGTNLGRFTLGSDLPRRQAATGSCATMSSSDVQTLPGWNTLKSTAESNWGKGSYNVVTNDKDYPNQPAQSCVSTDTVPITPSGTPSAGQSCTSQNSSSTGQEVGTSGTIALAHSAGTTSSTTSTVTKTSSIAVGVSVSATIGFPDIVDITSAFTFTGTFTNTLSTATTATSDQTSTETLTQTNAAGKTCHLEFTTQTCTITGSGQIPMIATGWVWFEYNSATDGHYKWALSIDDTLTNVADRSTYISFSSTTGTTTTSNYSGVCA